MFIICLSLWCTKYSTTAFSSALYSNCYILFWHYLHMRTANLTPTFFRHAKVVFWKIEKEGMLIIILERDNLITSNHDYKSGPRRKQIKNYIHQLYKNMIFPRVICMIIAVFIKILLIVDIFSLWKTTFKRRTNPKKPI